MGGVLLDILGDREDAPGPRSQHRLDTLVRQQILPLDGEFEPVGELVRIPHRGLIEVLVGRRRDLSIVSLSEAVVVLYEKIPAGGDRVVEALDRPLDLRDVTQREQRGNDIERPAGIEPGKHLTFEVDVGSPLTCTTTVLR